MEFSCFGTQEGNLDFGYYGKENLRRYTLENPGVRFRITPILPESGKLRGYFEGCLVPLITVYQDGLDHRRSEDCDKVREKAEFNSEFVNIAGRSVRVGKSTKGREVLKHVVEKTQECLIDNYAPPVEAMDSESWKRWRSSVAPFGGPDHFIDYLVELSILKRQ